MPGNAADQQRCTSKLAKTHEFVSILCWCQNLAAQNHSNSKRNSSIHAPGSETNHPNAKGPRQQHSRSSRSQPATQAAQSQKNQQTMSGPVFSTGVVPLGFTV